jgi:hypothetical protein
MPNRNGNGGMSLCMLGIGMIYAHHGKHSLTISSYTLLTALMCVLVLGMFAEVNGSFCCCIVKCA